MVIDETERYPTPMAIKGSFYGPEASDGFREQLGPWLPAPELEVLAREVAAAADLRGVEVPTEVIDRTRFFWKAAGGSSGGKARLGKAVKLNGLTAFFAAEVAEAQGNDDPWFAIWLAADHLAAVPPAMVKGVLLHELLHLGEDENGKPVLYPHDVTAFHQEVRALGAWSHELRQFLGQLAETQRQLS